jgi:hypothetical protein
MLDSCDEDPPRVEALPVVPEDARDADGLPGADGTRHEGMVVVDPGVGIVVVWIWRRWVFVFSPGPMEKDETAVVLLVQKEEGKWCCLDVLWFPD